MYEAGMGTGLSVTAAASWHKNCHLMKPWVFMYGVVWSAGPTDRSACALGFSSMSSGARDVQLVKKSEGS